MGRASWSRQSSLIALLFIAPAVLQRTTPAKAEGLAAAVISEARDPMELPTMTAGSSMNSSTKSRSKSRQPSIV